MTVVCVHLARVEPGGGDDPVLLGRLGAGELAAVGSLGFAADRDRAVTALAVARLELSRRLGLAPRLVPLLSPETTGGPPVVRGSRLAVSWSHSGEWVAVALASRTRVGVDIELVPERPPIEALRRAGIGSMREFVARQAAGKLSGRGLAAAPPPGATVRPFPAPPGYLGAVAAMGDDWSLQVRLPDRRDPPSWASATAIGGWDTVHSERHAYARGRSGRPTACGL